MKYFIIFSMLTLFLSAKIVDCVVPYNVAAKVKPLFKNKIAYSKLHIKIREVSDNKKALKYLKNKEAKFAIVRRDVLWQMQQEVDDLKDSYIVIAEMPFFEMLYLVQNVDSFDIDLESLGKKRVSIGGLGELANLYLKTLMSMFKMKNNIFYKSIDYKKSIKQIREGTLDAYFGFLLPCKESADLHFQTLFSEKTVAYFRSNDIFNINYNGIASPYILVASSTADDEEIENIIYRLMEKDIFVPVTDERFGVINRYVLNHLEQVKKVLAHVYKSNSNQVIETSQRSKKCRKYHYGFLKLLRQKPAWKKKLKKLGNPKKRKELIKSFNKILVQIDEQKDRCNLKFLNMQKRKFNRLKGE